MPTFIIAVSLSGISRGISGRCELAVNRSVALDVLDYAVDGNSRSTSASMQSLATDPSV